MKRYCKGILFFYVSVVCAYWSGAGMELSGRRMVWAHHVPWMRPDNASFMVENYYNFPLVGPLSGDYKRDLKHDMQAAMLQGFTGFSVDVIQTENGVTFDAAYADLLDAAQGTDFCVALCLDGKPDEETTALQLCQLINRFKTHPNFPMVDQKAVIFTYVFLSRSAEHWQKIRTRLKELGTACYLVANVDSGYAAYTSEKLKPYAQICDAFYAFSVNGLDGLDVRDKIADYSIFSQAVKKPYVASLSPGYYGAWLNGRNDFYQPHYGFDQLHRLFMLVDPSQSMWLHATTWNDHDETSLCPMVFTGANAEIVAAYAGQFMGKAPTHVEPRVYVAYPREVLAGTVCRIEAMTIPTALTGTLKVSGVLRNEQNTAVYVLPERELNVSCFDRQEWLVPTGPLARHAALIPELTVKHHTYQRVACLPALLPVNSHLQNAVTVKVGHHQMCAVKNKLTLCETNDGITAAITFHAAAPVKRISLWQNERPLALFTAPQKPQVLNIAVSGTGWFSLSVQAGSIEQALRTFTTNCAPEFAWNATNLIARGLAGWMRTAIQLGVSSNTCLDVASGAEKITITPKMLVERGSVKVGTVQFALRKTAAAYFNYPPLELSEGSLQVSVFGEKMRMGDTYWALYEMADQSLCWSLPTVTTDAVITQNLIQTAINLETPSRSSGSGDPRHREFFTPHAQTPYDRLEVTAQPVHRATIRCSFWAFNGTGVDSMGDQTLFIPETWFVPHARDNRSALVFDGTRKQKKKLRTWPSGTTTVDFWLRPAVTNQQMRQTLLYRAGRMDGISIYLEPDGHLAVVRDGDVGVEKVQLISACAIADGEWSRVRVVNDNQILRIMINGEEKGRCSLSAARSYGNCTWFIGGGAPDAANYMGALQDLFVAGIALSGMSELGK